MPHDQVQGLTDETTIGQLAGLLYEIDSQGRMKIESKEKARERGVRSPDRAEALMLALGELPPEYAFYPVTSPAPASTSLQSDHRICPCDSCTEQDRLDDLRNDLLRRQSRFGHLIKSRRFGPGLF